MQDRYYMLYDVYNSPQTFIISGMKNGSIKHNRITVVPGKKYEIEDWMDQMFINGLKAIEKQIPFTQKDYDKLIESGYENYSTINEAERKKPVMKKPCSACGGRIPRISFHVFKVVE